MSRYTTDTAAFAALLNELRGPLTGVASTLSKSSGVSGAGGKSLGSEDLHKLKFSELADRFEHLSQVLPDALRCVQEVKQIQQAVQQKLEILEGRQQSEESYLASLQELQEAILSQSGTLQDDIREKIAQLRQVLNDREDFLLSKVRETTDAKLSVVERQREQCLSTLEDMRAVSVRAHQALADEDPTVWLENGRDLEAAVTEQTGVRVEYGPSPDLRFACTLTVDLQRRILEVVDFDERKAPSPTRALPGGGAGGASYALSTSGASLGQIQLPDGTDYATFRRNLLAEGGLDASSYARSRMGAAHSRGGA